MVKLLVSAVAIMAAVGLAKADTFGNFTITDFLEAEQTACMATNIYHEARNESVLGQRAVAFVVLNRVNSPDHPTTVCDVVYESQTRPHWKTGKPVPRRNRCQFSWYCDGKSDIIKEQDKYDIAFDIARDVMRSYGEVFDPTEGATFYHANYVNPNWRHLERVVRIDRHIFYRSK